VSIRFGWVLRQLGITNGRNPKAFSVSLTSCIPPQEHGSPFRFTVRPLSPPFIVFFHPSFLTSSLYYVLCPLHFPLARRSLRLAAIGIAAEVNSTTSFVDKLGLGKANEVLYWGKKMHVDELVQTGFVKCVFCPSFPASS
jgi:hypothetical protein